MRRDPTNPHTWLLRAKSNLRRAMAIPRHPEVFLEDLCFDAQQAAEKALKAICLRRAVAFPKTHSLIHLFDLLEAAGVNIPIEVKEADRLTRYAVNTRYPGLEEEVTEAEHQTSVDLATRVVQWAEGVLEEDDKAKGAQ